MPKHVWCVWTEWGEYEQFSRDLRGVFSTEDLANAHASQLREAKAYDAVDVVGEKVLDSPPSNVPFIEYSAHIWPDGTEDRERGYDRGEKFRTWSNELPSLGESRIGKWHGDRDERPDLYIEVTGSDATLVAAEYARLLVLAREQLAVAAVRER